MLELRGEGGGGGEDCERGEGEEGLGEHDDCRCLRCGAVLRAEGLDELGGPMKSFETVLGGLYT